METKGHGTIKKSKALGTVGVLALATSLTIGTGNVLAEDVVTDTNSATTVVTDSNDTATTDVEADSEASETTATPTIEQVEIAQAELNEANQAVAEQEQVVANAETDVANAQSDVADAVEAVESAQEVASQATDENIANAQSDVANAQTNVEEASQAVTNAENEVSEAEENVAEQQTKVDTASQEVSTAKENVDSKQQAVETAQAVLDGTGASEIITQQEQAQSNYDTASEEVNQATSALEEAKKADSELADAIKEKQEEVKANTEAVETAQSDLTNATTTANETASALASALEEKTKADNEANAINTITLSEDYVTALTGYYATFSKSAYDNLTGTDSTASERTTARANYLSTLKDLNSAELANNSYASNENDKSVVITDLNNLSEEVRTNLSLFASDLINQIRTQFGTQLTSVTSSSVEASDLVTDGYVADNWSFGSGHDTSAIEKAGEELGAFSDGIGGIGENLNSWSRAYTTLSLDSLKRLVYQSIIAFMLNGNEWLHASSIAGLANSSEYIGVDISVRTGVTSVHVNDIEDEEVTSSSFSKTAITNPYDSATILANQASAQSAYDTAKAKDDTAQSALVTATNAYNTAVANLSKSTEELKTLQATPTQTATAESKLQEATANLTVAKEALDSANEAVANLNADIQTKTDALNRAKAELEQAKVELETAEANLSTEQSVLANLQNTLSEKQNALSEAQNNLLQSQSDLQSAQDYLTMLEQAPELLAQAQANLEEAQAVLAEKEAIYEEEYNKLLELKEQQAISQSAYDTIYQAYQDYLNALKQEQLAKQYADIVNNGGTPVAITDENGEIIGYVDANTVSDPQVVSTSSTVGTNSKTVATVNASQNDKKQTVNNNLENNDVLPQTGDETSNSVMAVGLGLLLSAFGLVDIRRKKAK